MNGNSFPLWVWQERDVAALRDLFATFQRICYQCPTGAGKCLRPGTQVLMFDGTTRAVEDLQVGDQLMGPDSEPRTIQQLGRGRGPMVEIRPTKGKSWGCNNVHILTLARTETYAMRPTYSVRRSDYRGGELVDVSVKDWQSWSKTQKYLYKLVRAGVDFPEQDLPISPYLLGVLLGDGDLKKRVNVTTADPEIVAVCEQEAGRWGLSLKKTELPNNQSSTYRFTTGHRGGKPNLLLQAVRALGLEGKRSGDKFIPHSYKTGSRTQRLEILAGLIDTDESVARRPFGKAHRPKYLRKGHIGQFPACQGRRREH